MRKEPFASHNGVAELGAGLADLDIGRASFELSEEDIEAARARIEGSGTSTTTSSRSSRPAIGRRSVSAPSVEDSPAFLEWRVKHPSVLAHFPEFVAHLKGKRLAVFLDYDGTLTPIVSNPEDAILSAEMRSVVRRLATQFPTAIISGRGREKVENFVKLKELYYAGSHGMDIAGPPDLLDSMQSRQDSSFQPAAHFRPIIDSVYKELCTRLANIPGSYVEHNIFCVSAHYRNCPGECWQQVVGAVEETLSSQAHQLKITRGRKVVEIRPKVNWHKGTALDHLLGVLGLRDQPDVVAIYIGDDRTDEDAFRVLQERSIGYGILVSSKIKETAASYTVRDPSEVKELLQGLVEWSECRDNGWLQGRAGAGARGGPDGCSSSWRESRKQLKGGGGGAAVGAQREAEPGAGAGPPAAAPGCEEQQKWQQWQQQVSSQQQQQQQHAS